MNHASPLRALRAATRRLTLVLSLLVPFAACSSSDSGPPQGTSGSNQNTGAQAGAVGASGSAGSGAGGASGAGAANTGGLPGSSGAAGSGGNTSGAAGSGANGGAVSSGGANNTSGSGPTAGAAGGGGAAGGSGGAGGGSAGSSGAGGANPACPGADGAEFALIQGWLNNTQNMGALPNYAYTNIRNTFPAGNAFNTLACSIAMSCVEFAPMESNWLRKCAALLTSAIVAESSYIPLSVVDDPYSTRNVGGVTAHDPTVGLLQIRFSSTVHDYNYYGPLPKMAAIGCNWPAALTTQADTASFWATAGGSTYLSFMQGVSCNVGLAAWYYFYNATGNGGATPIYIFDYCRGNGVAGSMVTGLLSHLLGPQYPRPPDGNNAYPWGIECCSCGNPSLASCVCNGCSGRFAAFMGIGTNNARPNPDPFQEALAPEVSKFCR